MIATRVFLQPYAWEAREFLRKLIINREVQFAVEHVVSLLFSGNEATQLLFKKKIEIPHLCQKVFLNVKIAYKRGGAGGIFCEVWLYCRLQHFN